MDEPARPKLEGGVGRILWDDEGDVMFSELFNVECNAMVDRTLLRPLAKVKVIHCGTN